MKKCLYILIISSLIKSAPIKLTPISDYLLKAGVEESKAFYSPTINEGEYSELHRRGHEIYEKFLEKIFLGTVFQFYTYIFLGYDMNYNYAQFKDRSIRPREYDIRKFNVLSENILNKKLYRIEEVQDFGQNDKLNAIKTAIDNLKQNQFLIDLGIAFERQKIVVEKLGQLLQKSPSETIQQQLLEVDRIDIDLLNMIYYFMQEAYSEFKQKLAKVSSADDAIRATDFLMTFKPQFASLSYYQDIIAQLNLLKQPIMLADFTR
ncbi:hypothetical protein A3F66_01930 [candidate division TM6 bacterium RIFCSPHIGHO2_12_FULL_32_22]|nr:MAG: hypothetical protein A3F66_01930 [candidate division TM6 bacterium RIFCSPHIGHO2_12_FULL_32_22]